MFPLLRRCLPECTVSTPGSRVGIGVKFAFSDLFHKFKAWLGASIDFQLSNLKPLLVILDTGLRSNVSPPILLSQIGKKYPTRN